MYELPLFPLNTVLFPGMPLPLQIFEERYKEMINLCIEEKRPFGVVLIREGVAERGPLAMPHEIGCTADIAQVQPLDDSGRLLIVSVGQERFRILSLRHDKSYLVGTVEPLPLEQDDTAYVEVAAERLSPLLQEYLEILAAAGEAEFDPAQLPEDPESLLYLAAAVIQLSTEQKQTLLEIDRASRLVRELYRYYKLELPILRLMPAVDQGPFSLN